MAVFSNLKENGVGETPVTLLTATQATVIAGCMLANITGSTKITGNLTSKFNYIKLKNAL